MPDFGAADYLRIAPIAITAMRALLLAYRLNTLFQIAANNARTINMPA
jgi:hypothetical protein